MKLLAHIRNELRWWSIERDVDRALAASVRAVLNLRTRQMREAVRQAHALGILAPR
ncbi:hypothetical protein [Longimicrobium sp.]|jgi:hypothetical protein|uniref:hypothetical protein n=1 Tax=Longimicrobium sp. TaxID=2029185 RepID=UPI002EDB51AD